MKNIAFLFSVIAFLTVSCRSERMAEVKEPSIVATDLSLEHKKAVVEKIKADLAKNPDALKSASPGVLAIAKEAGLIK